MDGKFSWLPETSLALRSRLRFVWQALCHVQPSYVLDIGCGTGAHLTQYVARLFPSAKVYGVDSDSGSLDLAKREFPAVQNLHFSTSLPEGILFDAIIASEVLEHVENPYEFLLLLRSKLKDDGVLIITVPNGYGCSELMSLMEALLHLSGIWTVLRKIKYAFNPKQKRQENTQDTLAVSPHINFFTFNRLTKIFSQCGIKQSAYQGRMFLHNFLCSAIIDKSEYLARINAVLGAKLPASLVSDWMFVLEKDLRTEPLNNIAYQRNKYERIRKYLNCKRYVRFVT